MILSSALCYCTAELLLWRGRPSSLVLRRPSVELVFSDTAKRMNVILGGNVPIHDIFIPFFFSKFKIFGPRAYESGNMGVNVSNDISSESTHQIHFPKSCIVLSLGKVFPKAVKIIVKFQTLNFRDFLFFFFGPFNMVVNGKLWNVHAQYLENGWS